MSSYFNDHGASASNFNTTTSDLTSSTRSRRGSVDSDISMSDVSHIVHHTSLHLMQSFHNLRSSWLERSFRHRAERHERIAMGQTSTGRNVYTMAQLVSLPVYNDEWFKLLPVTGNSSAGEEGMGNWIGWTVKGYTF